MKWNLNGRWTARRKEIHGWAKPPAFVGREGVTKSKKKDPDRERADGLEPAWIPYTGQLEKCKEPNPRKINTQRENTQR